MTGPQPETEMVDEPTDPDVDLRVPAERQRSWRTLAPVVAVVSAGGGLGAAARYGASLIGPVETGGFPWTTFWVNVTGCLVIGVFMVVVNEVWAAHPLVRPFFGTGVLGGYTTFSTYAVDIQHLVDEGHPRTGLAYLAATLVAALLAVWVAVTVTRRALIGKPGRSGETGEISALEGKRPL
ncbi:fluoride efflux transporter CrcB [Streptomyces cavernae]|uniref:fluoride efflux transporter CrcB n=1 Tax=Streptomyces cavernae TaxID=2259034 RepID=UPI000FEB9319|nr:fluoride efflux transporter CrcB [Streptomyces cavernae]